MGKVGHCLIPRIIRLGTELSACRPDEQRPSSVGAVHPGLQVENAFVQGWETSATVDVGSCV